MSPTYWTASQIKDAARSFGWEILPASMRADTDRGPWRLRKDNLTVSIQENRRGGLISVCLRRAHDSGADSVRLDHKCRDKLQTVLGWISAERIDWTQWGFRNHES